MPYRNVPDDLQDKMESCVTQVMDKGTDKEVAIAICYNSVVKGMTLEDATAEQAAIKAGSRNNADDRRRIREMRKSAQHIQAITMEMEPEDDDMKDNEHMLGVKAPPQGHEFYGNQYSGGGGGSGDSGGSGGSSLEKARAEWKGPKGEAVRNRADKTGTDVYQLRNGEFEIENDRYLDGGSRQAGDIDGVIRVLEEIERVAARVKSAVSSPPVQAERVYCAVKALGDWELDVCAVPFGGPNSGKDQHGEYFSAKTKTHADRYKNPLVLYYHGYDPSGSPQGTPETIGSVKSIEKRADGWWYRVILDKASEYAKRIWEAAKKGMAFASSGSMSHVVRIAPDGQILNWPVTELSLIDADGKRQPANRYAVSLPVVKSLYQSAGIVIPEAAGDAVEAPDNKSKFENVGENLMSTEIETAVKAALEKERAEQAAIKAAAEAEAARTEAAIKAAREAWEADAVKSNRLPNFNVIKSADDIDAFDGLDAADQAFLVGILNAQKKSGMGDGPSQSALKALAIKLEEDKGNVGVMGRRAMKSAGIKANELNYTTQANYGDEWVGISYSQALWEAIRAATWVADMLPSVEVPQGFESMYLPFESTDPTFYKIAETTGTNATTGIPDATITSSKVGTGRVLLTLSKMGARVPFSMEMTERSLVPFIPQLRAQITKAGAEQLEGAIIDGDTETGASTNINDIAGTPAATDLFLLFNGFRKLALVTNTANSRSAGGSLDVTDFLETVWLMNGGDDAIAGQNVMLISDKNTYKKAMTLPEVLTRDVFASPTIEQGKLTGLFGYNYRPSVNMHRSSSVRKANTAGKVDQDTTANNTTGAILAVNFNRWRLGYQRRMKITLVERPESDSAELVCTMTVGLINVDNEASAITYNVGV